MGESKMELWARIKKMFGTKDKSLMTKHEWIINGQKITFLETTEGNKIRCDGEGNKTIHIPKKFLNSLSDENIAAILLHETGHGQTIIRNLEVKLKFGLLVAMAIIVILLIQTISQRNLTNIFLAVILVPIVITLQLFASRRKEYEADAYAAKNEIGYEQMQQTLTKYYQYKKVSRYEQGIYKIDHPSIEERVENLKRKNFPARGAINIKKLT
jgi:Zn-dependent protease with chaperone function